jgi:hypothetical protein
MNNFQGVMEILSGLSCDGNTLSPSFSLFNFFPLNNFYLLSSYSSFEGVNRACVRRLKKTWDEVGEEANTTLKEMEDLMSHR